MVANRVLHSVIQYVILQEAAAQQSERRTQAWHGHGQVARFSVSHVLS